MGVLTSLVESPGLGNGQPEQVHLVENEPRRLNGSGQPAGVHNVELYAMLQQQITR